ncbi:MAG: cytochrome-c oxidase, cbb3-type subunit II, partial [Sphingobacteriaceae bacterium]|nr:cytochrome-c oxidase, cbb3-type subunit II [Sphingobacteriaceae bacterium]
TGYGMATFEGPMLSLKQINAVAHFTDWIVAHVHVGALAWNGFLTFGVMYWLIPRIYKTELFSKKMASFHFWIGTLGILFYAVPMYWAGFTQGLMWKEFTADGLLKYPNFLTTTLQIIPMHVLRSIGGALYLIGVIVMAINLGKTMLKGKLVANESAEAMPLPQEVDLTDPADRKWHRVLERKPMKFMVFSLIVILIGGMIEMMPTFTIESNIPTIASVKPYTALELQGRDLYIREGCVNCHTQTVRPFRSETERYGEYSKAGEFVYDHPFLWGSKRTGPDLHRIGGKYSNSWHFNHMMDPTSMSPGSIMPPYPWLITQTLDISTTPAKIRAMQTLGVPYRDGFAEVANENLKEQADVIAKDLKQNNIKVNSDKEIIALIAYLQRMGTDIKANKTTIPSNQ